MTGYQLVNATQAPGSRRNLRRRATFAFALGIERPPSSDGEASVWIVDAQGILILPADRARLGLAFLANGARESPD